MRIMKIKMRISTGNTGCTGTRNPSRVDHSGLGESNFAYPVLPVYPVEILL
ncbi:hypothetical protein HNQ60_002276 [Povalibacter uvarum]|uniref:Uncharacterized protein n=1 Tax=Povalibacter uvarum TaxID=732238 RepID=A0A841HMI9_9GAMM|nr:hypothetical protein [Povalibacter uvarum]